MRVRLRRARLFVRKELLKLTLQITDQLATHETPTPRSPHSVKREPARSRQCKQIFANLSHYLDGVLDDTLCKELEWHMRGCKPCEAFLASLQNTIEQTLAPPGQKPDPNAAARVRSNLSQQLQAVVSSDKLL